LASALATEARDKNDGNLLKRLQQNAIQQSFVLKKFKITKYNPAFLPNDMIVKTQKS
jgi:hypothetical protein